MLIGNAFTDVPALQTNVLVQVRPPTLLEPIPPSSLHGIDGRCIQRADGDHAAALADARRIGKLMWESRFIFQAELISLPECIAQATALLPVPPSRSLATLCTLSDIPALQPRLTREQCDVIQETAGLSRKVTIFSDAADATSSGASGDSNAILIGLLEVPPPPSMHTHTHTDRLSCCRRASVPRLAMRRPSSKYCCSNVPDSTDSPGPP